jgi:hypothetical protein
LAGLVQAQVVEAQALANSAKAHDDERKTSETLSQGASGAGLRLLSFFGSVEDPNSIMRGDILARSQAAVAARSIGPNPIAFQTPGDLRAAASNQAAQDAWQIYTAVLGRQMAVNPIRRNLEQIAAQPQEGPGLNEQRAAARQALAEQDRREPARLAMQSADQAGALAQRAQTEAGAQISAITLTQEQRRLDVAQDLATFRTQALNLEGQLAPFVMKRAYYEDQMALAMRDSLNSRLALIKAEKETTATGAPLADLDYQQLIQDPHVRNGDRVQHATNSKGRSAGSLLQNCSVASSSS